MNYFLIQSIQIISNLYQIILDSESEEEEEENESLQKLQRENSIRRSSSYKTEYSNGEEQNVFQSEINYERLYSQVVSQLNKNLKVKKQLEEFSNQVYSLINANQITKSQLFSIDPNFQIKKLLQKKSISFELSKAIEYSSIQCLLSFEKEKKTEVKNSQDLSPLVQSQLKVEQKEIPMTFRQNVEEQSHLSLSLERIPSNNLAILESHTNRICFQPHFNSVYQGIQLPDQLIDLDQTQRSDIGQQIDLTPDNTISQQLINEQQIHFDNEKLKAENQTIILDITARHMLDLSQTQIVNNSVNQQLLVEKPDLTPKNKLSDCNADLIQLEFVEKNLHSIVEEEQIPKENKQVSRIINNEKIDIINNSSTKGGNDNIDSNNQTQDKAVAQILNQKGMFTVKNSLQRASVTSSTRTSSSYAGVFVKEIIMKSKIPLSANQYKLLLVIFLFSFIGLNVTNLMIIQSDMTIFSNNVAILKQPHSFLRDFGKACFGFYLSLEYQLGFLHETDGSVQQAFNQYMESSVREYNSLIELYSVQLTQLKLAQPILNGEQFLIFQVYTDRQQSEVEVDYSLLFDQQQYYVMSINQNFTTTVRNDAFLYLRQNYFNFSSQVQDTVNSLVDDTISAVNNLISKFTIVIICAIIGIIFVGIISLPIIKAINAYEEKIMMIVSRINFDTSEIEKCKLLICKKLINVDMIDWLNYNYFDIFALQTQKNDLLQSQSSKHNLNENLLQTFSTRRKKRNTENTENIKKINQSIAIEASGINLMNSSTIQLKNSGIENESKPYFSTQLQKSSKLRLFDVAKSIQQLAKTAKAKRNQIANYQQQKQQQSANNNYLLQSKIANQSLTWFNRFLTLLVLTFLNCIYFLTIIVYLTQSNDQLKVPVQMNQRSINMHIILTNLKMSTELLAFDFYIQDQLWSNYQITNLQQYYDQMNESISQLIDIQQQNTAIIYGNNPFPSSIINQLKNMQQGEGCQYLVTYLCQDYNAGLGIQQTITEKIKFIEGYPDVLNTQLTIQSQLISYLNDYQHLAYFVYSFLSEDELFDVYSNVLNESISTVSLVIQDFLQNYLIIAGTIMAIFILITILIHWNSLFQRIQLMNLLLTFVPQDKLEEEVTLHMVRQLHRM